jgi:hypothetical protein
MLGELCPCGDPCSRASKRTSAVRFGTPAFLPPVFTPFAIYLPLLHITLALCAKVLALLSSFPRLSSGTNKRAEYPRKRLPNSHVTLSAPRLLYFVLQNIAHSRPTRNFEGLIECYKTGGAQSRLAVFRAPKTLGVSPSDGAAFCTQKTVIVKPRQCLVRECYVVLCEFEALILDQLVRPKISWRWVPFRSRRQCAGS